MTKPALTKGLLFFMAAGSGLSVASNYYVQPLLDILAREFSRSTTEAGLLVTLAQIGYTIGLVAVVPLGDRFERRRLLFVSSALTAIGLFAMALSPDFLLFGLFSIVVGTFSVTAQIIVPLAAHLAEDKNRGSAVSTVMSGLLLGILLARTFSGIVADFAGWRVVYFSTAILMSIYAFSCLKLFPSLPPTSRSSLRSLYGSILLLFRDEPVLRRRAVIGLCQFGAFAIFWTAMAFMLAERYHMSESLIGLFGLVGAIGVFAARIAGKTADLGWAKLSTGVFTVVTALSWGLLYWGQWSLIPFIIGIVLLDLGVQGVHISNQSEIYRLNPEARSRLTTGYMSCYFLGGVLGSAGAAFAYGHGGWGAVMILGAVVSVFSLCFWAVTELRLPFSRMRH